jgi:hypothetical protein
MIPVSRRPILLHNQNRGAEEKKAEEAVQDHNRNRTHRRHQLSYSGRLPNKPSFLHNVSLRSLVRAGRPVVLGTLGTFRKQLKRKQLLC